jgi:trans-2,3-dihydro-3-hydroxyanthranilate isomerase
MNAEVPRTDHMLSVFVGGPGGGNAVPVFIDADELSDAQMQTIARDAGVESAFLSTAANPETTGQLRYWVPNHEMSMCGHATIGTAWVLHHLGWEQPADGYLFDTASGPVRAGADDLSGWFEQTVSSVEAAPSAEAMDALGLHPDDVVGVVQNAAAPRVKTLIPLRSVSALDALDPDPKSVEAACEALGSTGLYPYVMQGTGVAHARQFPRSSGYREDPATGIAAAALFFGLRASGSLDRPRLEVRQGEAMKKPSRIVVEAVAPNGAIQSCRVSGDVIRLG